MKTPAQVKELLGSALGVEPGERDYALSGCHLRLELAGTQVVELARLMKREGFFLEFVTAVDRDTHLELVYSFTRHRQPLRLQATLRVERGGFAPSLAEVFAAADWQEREVFDMFGIVFAGHPNLKRLLLPEDADFHPLLRDFTPRPEHGGEVVDLEVG